MEVLIIIIFLVSYAIIAFEHQIEINKAGVALIAGVLLWVISTVFLPELISSHNSEEFALFLKNNPSIAKLSIYEQSLKFTVDNQIVEHLGDISETLFFLVGAMTIVEVIDTHGGFTIITNRITTRSKIRLVWVISIITFFLSALLDNMTTAIVMTMLIRKLVPNTKERWLYAAIIIIAANSGGAWSPIGDITTIMLWVNGNISAADVVPWLLVPSLVACIIPTWIGSRLLHGMIIRSCPEQEKEDALALPEIITKKERLSISIFGIGCLLSIPFFKSLTHLPPFMGVLLALGMLWVYTEIVYDKNKQIEESLKNRISHIIQRIDIPTVLFFLGILLAVAALDATGILAKLAVFLEKEIGDVYLISILIGLLSSIVDNVPLVAATISMYPIVDPAQLSSNLIDATYLANFVSDGIFWHFLAYCAGVGGSILIIGSVAGVVVMGLEKISFAWYFKNISFMTFVGFVCGALVYIVEVMIFT